jgi:heme-degrading monooxygenase HmoA
VPKALRKDIIVILEAGILNVRPAQQADFEEALERAKPLISATPGFLSFELHRCVENSHRYLLLVQWESVEAHTVGFRQSDRYQRWRALLHHFYDPFPTIEHFRDPICFGLHAR